MFGSSGNRPGSPVFCQIVLAWFLRPRGPFRVVLWPSQMLGMVGRTKNAFGLLGRICIFKNKFERPEKPSGLNLCTSWRYLRDFPTDESVSVENPSRCGGVSPVLIV